MTFHQPTTVDKEPIRKASFTKKPALLGSIISVVGKSTVEIMEPFLV